VIFKNYHGFKGVHRTLLSEAVINGRIETVITLLKLGATKFSHIDEDRFKAASYRFNPVQFVKRMHVCLSIVDRYGYIGEYFETFPSDIQLMLVDWKFRYKSCLALLGIAKKTGNKIIDKNLLFKIAKLIWTEKNAPKIETIQYIDL